MMGGEIDVESEVGKGSTFRFTAVFKKQPPREDKETEKMQKEFVDAAGDIRSAPHFLTEDERHNARILLAEDNIVNRELMIEQFESAGFASLLTAENGKEAVERTLKYHPDLVLMDIQMPVMDGNEAIVLLKENGYKGPIISLSAMAMKEDIERSLKAGAVDYITKPVDFDSFFVKIAKFLSKAAGKTETGSAGNDINGNSDSLYRIKSSVSKRIREVFIVEASEKLKTLNGITDIASLEEKKKELTFISHGYKGNARHLGLLPLEAAAADLNNSLKDNEPAEILLELVAKLARILTRMVEENEK